MPYPFPWNQNSKGLALRLMKEKKQQHGFQIISENKAVWFDLIKKLKLDLHLLSLQQASLDQMNTLLPEPVPINRFRPNFLVDNCDPFGEDLWDEIKINDLVFQGVRLCSRCKVPTVNKETGIPGVAEPAETLMKFRSDKVLMPDKKPLGKVFFGKEMVWNWNITNIEGEGKKTIRVGDSISVLRKIPSRAEAAA